MLMSPLIRNEVTAMKNSLILLSLVIIISGCSTNHNSMKDSNKMKKAPFGNAEDISYAKTLWHKMNKHDLNDTPATLYVGGPPHGKVREVLEGRIDGKRIIVKRNYGGEGVSVKAVKANRSSGHLKSITVMAKREAGYDPDNNDWFWAKYKADGQLHNNPKGMLLAGRIAKGMDKGCIACHTSASGNDMVFIHNKDANAEITIVN